MIKKLFLILTLSVFAFSFDEIYFLPNDAKKAENKIIELMDNAQSNIDIAMYNLSYKKFAKKLKKAAKRGVGVTLIYGKSKLKFYKKINLIETKRKQHIKLAIIDNKFAIYGSANWKKASFGENYEIINITDDKEKLKKFQKIFETMKREN